MYLFSGGVDIQRDGAGPEEEDAPGADLIPNEADFLLGYATVPGFVSYRSRSRGSWYITKLTEVLNKHAHRYGGFHLTMLKIGQHFVFILSMFVYVCLHVHVPLSLYFQNFNNSNNF